MSRHAVKRSIRSTAHAQYKPHRIIKQKINNKNMRKDRFWNEMFFSLLISCLFLAQCTVHSAVISLHNFYRMTVLLLLLWFFLLLQNRKFFSFCNWILKNFHAAYHYGELCKNEWCIEFWRCVIWFLTCSYNNDSAYFFKKHVKIACWKEKVVKFDII